MRQPCWSNMDLPSTPLAPDGDNPSGGFPALDKSATPTSIENAYELLSPGTWYLDQTHHVIYYDPWPGGGPLGHELRRAQSKDKGRPPGRVAIPWPAPDQFSP